MFNSAYFPKKTDLIYSQRVIQITEWTQAGQCLSLVLVLSTKSRCGNNKKEMIETDQTKEMNECKYYTCINDESIISHMLDIRPLTSLSGRRESLVHLTSVNTVNFHAFKKKNYSNEL